MSEPDKLIAPPPIVRDRLARNIKERRLLRALLRLSVRAAEECRREGPEVPRHEADGDGMADMRRPRQEPASVNGGGS
jgi:hypothetical protein